MPAALRRLRLIYYSVTAFCLIYMANVLQHVLHDLLLRAGLTDAITLGGLLDHISDLPIFTNMGIDSAVFVIGVTAWKLVNQDRSHIDHERSGVIRAGFLSALTTAFGLRILLSLILIAHNLTAFSQSNIPVASSIAAVVAWSIALGLVQGEWASGGMFGKPGQKIAMFFALLGQWVLVVMAIWAIAQAIESYLQSLVAPLPTCSSALNIAAQLISFIIPFSQPCSIAAQPGDATVTMGLILVALALFVRWTLRYNSPSLAHLDAVIGALIAGITILLNSVLGARLILDLITRNPQARLLQSLLLSPSAQEIAGYPFVGPLVAGACALVCYWLLIGQRKGDRRYGVVALSFPVALAFFVGICWLLGHALAAALYIIGVVEIPTTLDDWRVGLMLFVPGALWGGLLWRPLEEMASSTIGRAGISVPGRVYVNFFSNGTWGAALIGAMGFIALVGTALLRVPLDSTNYFAPHAFAITLTTFFFARHYHNLKRKW